MDAMSDDTPRMRIDVKNLIVGDVIHRPGLPSITVRALQPSPDGRVGINPGDPDQTVAWAGQAITVTARPVGDVDDIVQLQERQYEERRAALAEQFPPLDDASARRGMWIDCPPVELPDWNPDVQAYANVRFGKTAPPDAQQT